MSQYRKLAVASISLVAFSVPAMAQTAPPADSKEEGADATGTDIIVTARRRDESAQDVPLTVNALKAESLAKLNIREFKDIQTLVPGLSLTPATDGIAPSATLRGVNYDVNNSGSNGTVQFYMNDAPVAAALLLQSMFDIGQIEVLRGPQGTLRGIASPSGSITVTTRRPDLSEIGGYVTGTVTNIGGVNVNGAVNIPLIEGVLAVRVAGLVNDDEANRVNSINYPSFKPFSRARGERISVRFDPVENIDLNASYQHYLNKAQYFDQVESANLALGGPQVGTLLTAADRAAVENGPRNIRQEYSIYNLQGEWRFAGQKLNYVGGWSTQEVRAQGQDDMGNAYGGAGFPGNGSSDQFTAPNLLNYGQSANSRSSQYAHELRLSSDERLFGMLDYVIGGLINRASSPTDLNIQTPVFIAGAAPSPAAVFPAPGSLALINQTALTLTGRTLERSAFGNLTAHIGETTEISGGIRYIHFNNISLLTGTSDYHATIYSASLKHRFNENVMAYVSTGSSWRVGAGTNAIILSSSGNFGYSDAGLAAILGATPETSKSYEVGLKTDWLEKRLRFNATYYHQNFDNYIFSSSPVLFLANNGASPPTYTPNVTRAGLSVGVPVKVDGVEVEVAFEPSQHFNIDGTLSYSLGKITNGLVPCSGASLPVAPQQINFCTVNQRASLNAPFNASLQAEYNHAVTDRYDGFVRGQFAYHGTSQNDPTNPYDDVKAYGLLNLYAGVRNTHGAWEITAYGKNIFNTQRVLTRAALPAQATYADTAGSGGALVSNYRVIAMTAPQEFGLSVRYSFGSR